MNYNNRLRPLILPEYGRNIQQMVDHCLTITDEEKRKHCVDTIINTMSNVAPEHKKSKDGMSVYWDHLALMSNFSPLLKFPDGTITEERIKLKVDKYPYQSHRIKYKYYGHLIEKMIDKIVAMPQGEERQQLEYLVALQMKRSYLTWNKDYVDDLKIFKDLFEISDGQILLTPENCTLILPNESNKNNNRNKGKKNKRK